MFVLLTNTIAQSCLPDLSFGESEGYMQPPFSKTSAYEFNSVLLQTDGKIVVSGFGADFNYSQFIRLLNDGKLDSSFGINASSYISNFRCNAMLLQQDGKILAVGSNSAYFKDFVLIRLNVNGLLDSTFDDDGIQQTDFSIFQSVSDYPFTNDIAYSLAIQNDGKIIVAGSTSSDNFGNVTHFSMARYKSDGSIDSSFGYKGRLVTHLGVGTSSIASIIIQGDGKILSGGTYVLNNVGSFALVRYQDNGLVDSAFGIDGKSITTLSATSICRSIAMQGTEKIIAGGAVGTGINEDFLLIRYNNKGSIDSTFGIDGKIETDFSLDDVPASLIIMSDQKIMMSGNSGYGGIGAGHHTISRYTVNGKIDSSFNVNGKFSNDRFTSIIDNIILQTDGKILVAGNKYEGRYPSNLFLARYYIADFIVPINLLNFQGNINNNNIQLKWKLATPLNFSDFVVERSNNGLNFYSIGKINKYNNTGVESTFLCTDTMPLSGNNYYRLKQVDNDGKFHYSEIIVIKFENIKDLLIYPNPTSGFFKVDRINLTSKAHLKVFNSIGKIVNEIKNFNTNQSINIEHQPQGLYFITITTKEKLYKSVIIKR